MMKKSFFRFFAVVFGMAIFTAAAGEFGFCSHLQRHEYPDADKTLALLKENGASLVRFDFDWVWIEPKPGVYRFDRYDHLFTLAKKHGIEIEGIFGAEPPKWCRPLEKYQQEYLKYVEAFTKHFKGRLKYVEIINETNLDIFWGSKPNPEAYADFLRKSCELIKSIDPGVTVLYSGTAGVPLDFIEKSLKTGLTGHVDAFNIHPYTWETEPELALPDRIGRLQTLLKKYGFAKTSIWVTEIGTSTGANVNTASFLKAAFAEAKIDPAKSGLAILRDDEVGIGNLGYYLDEVFGKFARQKIVSSAELSKLDVRRYNVLLLPTNERIHAAAPAAITAYLKKGGTVLSLDGFPAYFERTPAPKGSFTERQVSFKNTDAWHLGASAWWIKEDGKNGPFELKSASAKGLFPLTDFKGKAVSEMKVRFMNRFLSTKGLKGGDTFKPLLFARNGEYERPIAGVYCFNSDLKGNFIICVGTRESVLHGECCSLDVQARRIGRELLLCRGLGIDTNSKSIIDHPVKKRKTLDYIGG